MISIDFLNKVYKILDSQEYNLSFSPAKFKNYMLYCNGNFIGGRTAGAAGTRLPRLLRHRPAQDAGDPGGTLGEGAETALCREI